MMGTNRLGYKERDIGHNLVSEPPQKDDRVDGMLRHQYSFSIFQ